MELETLPQQPEGALLKKAQQASGRTVKEVADQAGMSDTRWRQIVKGFIYSQNIPVPVVAPASTLANMARAVSISPEQLRQVGRDDAAEALEMLTDESKPLTRRARSARMNDEIELIYASKSMTAEQKLDAIRMVLQLRAEIEAGSGAVRPKTVQAKTHIPTPTVSGQVTPDEN